MAVALDLAPSHDRELVLARILDATPEQVFRTWTTPATYPDWFCPKPWRAEIDRMDLRPGGAAENTMYGPGGEVMNNRGVYLEVVPGRKVVFTDAYTEGWVPAVDGGMMTAVVTFEPHGEGQTLWIARVGHPTVEKKAQHEQMGFHAGWGVMVDQLEAVAKTL